MCGFVKVCQGRLWSNSLQHEKLIGDSVIVPSIHLLNDLRRVAEVLNQIPVPPEILELRVRSEELRLAGE